jgi:hypothetical protein
LPREAAYLTQLAMRSKAHWGYPDQFMLACREELTLDQPYIENNPVCVGEYAGRVIGFYALEHASVAETELGFLFVDPDFTSFISIVLMLYRGYFTSLGG